MIHYDNIYVSLGDVYGHSEIPQNIVSTNSNLHR